MTRAHPELWEGESARDCIAINELLDRVVAAGGWDEFVAAHRARLVGLVCKLSAKHRGNAREFSNFGVAAPSGGASCQPPSASRRFFRLSGATT